MWPNRIHMSKKRYTIYLSDESIEMLNLIISNRVMNKEKYSFTAIFNDALYELYQSTFNKIENLRTIEYPEKKEEN